MVSDLRSPHLIGNCQYVSGRHFSPQAEADINDTNVSISIPTARPELGKICEILQSVAGFAHQFSGRESGGRTTVDYNRISPDSLENVWQYACLFSSSR